MTFKISPVEPLSNIMNPREEIHICNSRNKAGIMLNIVTYFIEHPDTESAEIK